MIKRLRYKFILIATLSVTAVMVLLTIILNVANYYTTDSNIKSTLNLISENEGTIPENFGLSENDNKVQGRDKPEEDKPPRNDMFNAETPFSTRYFVVRFTNSGQIVSASLDKIAAVKDEDLDKYVEYASNLGEDYGLFGDYRVFVKNIDIDKKMAIFLDTFQESQNLKNVLFWSIIADFVCILLVFVLVVLFSKRAIDPVVQANEKQKQFITDAGHELKTPITVISMNLSVLEMDVGNNVWINKTRSQINKLTNLVTSLVSLARYDEEDDNIIQRKEFNVFDCIEDIVHSFQSVASTRENKIHTHIPIDLSFRGDERAFRELVSILIDNATKYSPMSSCVLIDASKNHKYLVLSVENDLSDNIEIDTGKMFDRFYRGDKARSSNGSFGIGLAIARSIAEAHDGKIEASINRGKLKISAFLK